MKIVFEFTKTGNLIYVSHLDLMRLFLRGLRMSGLRPVYSVGYNPHPKLSLALPLSLGLHSVCELLEFETEELPASGGGLAESVLELNHRLPEGVRVTAFCEKPASLAKSLASYVTAASYEFMCDGIFDASKRLTAFFAKDSVVALRRDKKTGGEAQKELRHEMLDYRVVKELRGRMLAEVTLSAAPGRTLNPAVFFRAFCEASELKTELLSPVITRTAILGVGGVPLSNAFQVKNA